MPFNTTNEGTPTPRPVEAVVPVAPREPQGERIGGSLLSAMVQGALGRERSQIDREQMVQQADVLAKEMAFKRDQMAMTHQYQMGELSLRSQQYEKQLQIAAIGETHRTTTVGRAAEAAKQWYERSQQQQAFDTQAQKDAGQLNDPSYWANNPIEAADKFIGWKGKYGSAAEGEVPQMIKEWQARADLTKLSRHVGAQWIPDQTAPDTMKSDGTTVETKGKFTAGHFAGGNVVTQPAWQVLQDWKSANPEQRNRIQQELAAAGNRQTIHHQLTNVNSVELDENTRNMLKTTEKGTFVPGNDQVPRELKSKYFKNKPYYAPDPAYAPAPDAPMPDAPMPDTSYNTPTKTDLTLQHARNALAANPGARQTIMQRLQGMGIDPVHLDA